MACKRSSAPQTLKTQTIGMDQEARAASANVATPARMAATRSPYAAGIANVGESEGDTTPGTRKLSPTNRNVWGDDQWHEGIRSAHAPESRPDVHLRDDAEREKAHQDA